MCFTWPRYQAIVYRTVGPLVAFLFLIRETDVRGIARAIVSATLGIVNKFCVFFPANPCVSDQAQQNLYKNKTENVINYIGHIELVFRTYM